MSETNGKNGHTNGNGILEANGNGKAKLAPPMPDSSQYASLFPNSKKIYIEGALPGVRVPLREVSVAPTRNFKGELEPNRPVRVYDCSGPYTDPAVKIDVRQGLAALRASWIAGRGDVESYTGRPVQPRDNGYLSEVHAEGATQREGRAVWNSFPSAVNRSAPRRARTSARCITPARGSSRRRWSISPSARIWDGKR